MVGDWTRGFRRVNTFIVEVEEPTSPVSVTVVGIWEEKSTECQVVTLR